MRLAIGLILIFILPGSLLGFWEGYEQLINVHKILYPVLTGMGIGCLVYPLLLRRNYAFLTFEHELTHALMGMVFFRKITRFISTRNSGGVIYHTGGFGGEFGNIIIAMAPYYLPTFTILAVFIRPFIPVGIILWFDGFIGITIVFHLLSTISEIRNNWNSNIFPEAESGIMRQTDIASTGFLLSAIFIITLNIFFHGMVFWMLVKGYHGFTQFVNKVFYGSYGFYVTGLKYVIKWVPNS